MVRVILQENFAKLGKVCDEVEVNRGYARNLLVRKKIAVYATAENRKKVELYRDELLTKEKLRINEAKESIARLEGVILILKENVADDGKLFGSITKRRLAKELGDRGYNIKYTDIVLQEPIKFAGDYELTISPHADTSVTIKCSIVNVNEIVEPASIEVPEKPEKRKSKAQEREEATAIEIAEAENGE